MTPNFPIGRTLIAECFDAFKALPHLERDAFLPANSAAVTADLGVTRAQKNQAQPGSGLQNF